MMCRSNRSSPRSRSRVGGDNHIGPDQGWERGCHSCYRRGPAAELSFKPRLADRERTNSCTRLSLQRGQQFGEGDNINMRRFAKRVPAASLFLAEAHDDE